MSNDDLTPDVSGTFNIDQLTTMYLPANIPSKDSPMFCKNKKLNGIQDLFQYQQMKIV